MSRQHRKYTVRIDLVVDAEEVAKEAAGAETPPKPDYSSNKRPYQPRDRLGRYYVPAIPSRQEEMPR